MEPSSFSDDLHRILALITRWFWLMILAPCLFGAAALLLSRQVTPVYESATTLLVNEAPIAKSIDYTSILTSERLARTYAELLTKKPVLEEVIGRMELDMGVNELLEAVQVQLVRDTQLIELKVEHTEPALAAEIANTVVEVFSERNIELQTSRFAVSKQNLQAQLSELEVQIRQGTEALEALGDSPEDRAKRNALEVSLAQSRETYNYILQSYEQIRVAEASSTSNVVQVEPASPPLRPIRPRLVLNTLLAALIGLALSLVVAFLNEMVDDSLKTPDEITRHLDLPILGLIATHAAEDGQPVVVSLPRSPVAEAFRSLRTNIEFASVDRPLTALMVTSASPSEGKSTVAVNLAAMLAQGGRQVAVIDADLRRPQLHLKLGLPNRAGITSLFVQPVMALKTVLQATASSGLFAITSGELPPNPAELLGSEKMLEILTEVRRRVDMAVIDSPPVNVVTDAVVLAPRVDGVLLVIKPGETRLALARQAVDQLQRSGAHLLGIVLNEVDTRGARAYHYKGYYYAQDDPCGGPQADRPGGLWGRLKKRARPSQSSGAAAAQGRD